jgi:HSP20 family protein
LEDQLLTIQTTKEFSQPNEDEKQIRREYTFRSFSRSFTLDKEVDANAIEASYENGILKIRLPKKEEAKMIEKEITVA